MQERDEQILGTVLKWKDLMIEISMMYTLEMDLDALRIDEFDTDLLPRHPGFNFSS